MLLVTAVNVTGKGRLQRPDGTSDYEVWVGINTKRIWDGTITSHVRDDGASVLLRTIADRMEGSARQTA